MRSSNILPIAATLATASAQVYQGFNYGSVFTNNAPITRQNYVDLFTTARNLQGTSGFTSARLFTTIQAGTTNSPIEAIPAATDTDTQLLLGIFLSATDEQFNNEVTALQSAITQYGQSFVDRVIGISVGSEDLYRISPTGIENMSNPGEGPDAVVRRINQVRQALSGTIMDGKPIGHVDTWTAYINSSNAAVIEACDFIGTDAYPYFQNTQENSIENGADLFFDAYNATVAVAQGKPVWITETGWPVSGPTENLAVPSLENAEQYWDDVACRVLGSINTFWYILQDAAPTTPSPSFGLVGSTLSTTPLYDLSCGDSSSSPQPSGDSPSSSPSRPAVSSPSVPAPSGSGNDGGSSAPAPPAGGNDGGSPAPPAAGNDGGSPAPAPPGAGGNDGGSPAPAPPAAGGNDGGSPAPAPPAAGGNDGGSPAPAPPAAGNDGGSPAPATPAAGNDGANDGLPAGLGGSPNAGETALPRPTNVPGACPADLSGEFEFPHLIVPLDETKPDTAFGTQFNGKFSPTVSTVFNFDFPASLEGRSCNVVFLFPKQEDLVTSSYTVSGSGGIEVSRLNGIVDESTTFNNAPGVNVTVGAVPNVQPGNSYSVAPSPPGGCYFGGRVSYQVSATGSLDLEYFQNYHPAAIGLYITVC
ncbi:MAG: hypothetical protein Q9183_005187 [Haloplaca sp. 2 TL-2023]